MKTILTLVISCFLSFQGITQSSYIQVSGESNLSVYLNGEFKGKTTVEFNGLVIENVKAGEHLIKVVKDGYVPYEEKVNVKAGEVLLYKVKPFSKHTISISEEGTTDATDTKEKIATGKLMVQSVPIEIKITIQGIEGAERIGKTKDQWTANDLPAGNYNVKFFFGNKTLEKNITILKDETTRVFVNMMSGEVKESNSREDYIQLKKYTDSLSALYMNFQPLISQSEFILQNPQLKELKIKTADGSMAGVAATSYYIDYEYYQKKRKSTNVFEKGFFGYMVNPKNEVINYTWNLEVDGSIESVQKIYSVIKADVATKIPANYWREWNESRFGIDQDRVIITVPYQKGNYYITFKFFKYENSPQLSISYSTHLALAEW